jgi:CheY-specific phosphatase CheX
MTARFFGQYLLGEGLITAPQLLAAVEYQDRNNARLGEHAVAMGIATPFEVERILSVQARDDRYFGEAAIALGILTASQVTELLAAQQDAHLQLGEALVDLGYMDPGEVERAASAFLGAEDDRDADSVYLPDEVAGNPVLPELLYLARKMLLRVCNVVSKPEDARIARDVVPLSDRNVRVALTGEYDGSLVLGLPRELAVAAASRFSGERAPTEADLDAIAEELGHILSGNLCSVMAERLRRLQAGAPQLLPERVSTPPGQRVLVVPFVTPHGQVLVCLTLRPA